MSEDDNILGTQVPDLPINRASLWLDDIKYNDIPDDERVPDVIELCSDDFYQRIIDGLELDTNPHDLSMAAQFYGSNMASNLGLVRSVGVSVMLPTGKIVPLFELFPSVWLDGFMHGAALAREKVGPSRAERQAGKILDD